jgi:hypothetical protein
MKYGVEFAGSHDPSPNGCLSPALPSPQPPADDRGKPESWFKIASIADDRKPDRGIAYCVGSAGDELRICNVIV